MTAARRSATPTPAARQRPDFGAVRVLDGGRRGVPALVTVRRAHVEALEAEVVALAAEGLDFATSMRARADRLYLAITAERLDLAAHEAAAIHVEAERRLRQLTPDGAA